MPKSEAPQRIDRSPTLQHLNQLLDYKVDGVVRDCNEEVGNVYGLRLTINPATGKPPVIIAWILCDPEGNGPGHLDIQRGV